MKRIGVTLVRADEPDSYQDGPWTEWAVVYEDDLGFLREPVSWETSWRGMKIWLTAAELIRLERCPCRSEPCERWLAHSRK